MHSKINKSYTDFATVVARLVTTSGATTYFVGAVGLQKNTHNESTHFFIVTKYI